MNRYCPAVPNDDYKLFCVTVRPPPWDEEPVRHIVEARTAQEAAQPFPRHRVISVERYSGVKPLTIRVEPEPSRVRRAIVWSARQLWCGTKAAGRGARVAWRWASNKDAR